MNLKYYLRGLGVGILVTALIMGVSARNHTNTMSESEIRAEAEKLGMVDGRSVLKETEENVTEKEKEAGVKSQAEDEAEKKNSEDGTSDSVSTNAAVSSNRTAEDSPEIENEKNDEGEAAGNETENTIVTKGEAQKDKTVDEKHQETEETKESTTDNATITITVQSGEGSQTVARKLAEAGIVENALDYDRFLCQNGYDKKLRVGSFEIPVGASDDEIAKILTRK